MDAIYLYDDILQTTNVHTTPICYTITRTHKRRICTHTTYNDIKSPHIVDGRRKSHRARYNNMQNTHPHGHVIIGTYRNRTYTVLKTGISLGSSFSPHNLFSCSVVASIDRVSYNNIIVVTRSAIAVCYTIVMP